MTGIETVSLTRRITDQSLWPVNACFAVRGMHRHSHGAHVLRALSDFGRCNIVFVPTRAHFNRDRNAELRGAFHGRFDNILRQLRRF